MTFSRSFFLLFTIAAVVGFAWGLVDGIDSLAQVPTAPTSLTRSPASSTAALSRTPWA